MCTRLQEFGLVIKLEKCLFGEKSLNFLGQQISQFGSIPLPDEVKAIEDFPKPSTVKGLQEYLGMINFYHRFLPHAALSLQPLYRALTKSQPRQVLNWTTDMNTAFVTSNTALAEATMLSHPESGAHISVTTDASGQAVGAVIE